MSKTQKQNLLALSVAGLVASSVAAIAGVTTLSNDLTGKAVYLAMEMQCSGGCWYDSGIHGCKCPESGTSGGSAYPSSGTANTGTAGANTTTSTTSGPTGLNCAGGTLATCQATCTKDGVTNRFCMGYCSQECPSASTTAAGTSTTSTVTNRCAYEHECAGIVRCLIELGVCGSPKTGEKQTCDDIKAAATARGVKSPAVNMETGMAYCDELKAAPPPAPVAEEPAPVVPAVEAPPAVQAVQEDVDVQHEAAFEEDSFEDESDDFERREYEDFGDFGDDFGGGFHEGPGDFGGDFGMGFGGHDEEFMRSMMDQYGDEFSLGEDDFSGYFGDFGPGMDGGDFGFGGEFGGGFGGDEFGGMPEWMSDELEGMKDMMRGMAEHMCPDLAEEIDDIEDFEGMEDLGFRMQEECMGGDMGGGPDPEMMENAAKMLQIFGDKDGPVSFALGVAKKHDVFTDDEVKDIEEILVQIGEKAEEAKEVCTDLPEPPDMGGEFFGLHGLLAQLFDDEEEDDEDADDFFGGDEGEIPEEFQVFEDCGNILDEALGAGPGQDEDEGPGGLMGELEELMRVPMEEAVENGTIPEDEWAEVENRFNAVMEDLGFEGEFEDHESDENFGDFDSDEEEDEEFGDEDEGGKAGGGGFNEEEEEEFSDEDFEF